jgi:hypothetical protein
MFGVGIDGGREDASGNAECAADESEEDGLGKELDPDVASRGAQGAAQPDFGSSLQDGDDHDVGHPDCTDQ